MSEPSTSEVLAGLVEEYRTALELAYRTPAAVGLTEALALAEAALSRHRAELVRCGTCGGTDLRTEVRAYGAVYLCSRCDDDVPAGLAEHLAGLVEELSARLAYTATPSAIAANRAIAPGVEDALALVEAALGRHGVGEVTRCVHGFPLGLHCHVPSSPDHGAPTSSEEN